MLQLKHNQKGLYEQMKRFNGWIPSVSYAAEKFLIGVKFLPSCSSIPMSKEFFSTNLIKLAARLCLELIRRIQLHFNIIILVTRAIKVSKESADY